MAGARAATVPRSEIVEWNAVALSQAIHQKKVSCREVMQATLAQVDAMNPKVNAIVSLQERDGLLKQADERDAQLARGQSLGWMHGFPQAPKDLAATAGIVRTLYALSEHYRPAAIQRAGKHQLLQHSVDTIDGFPDVLENQNAIGKIGQEWRAAQRGQHGEIAPDQSSLGLAVADLARLWCDTARICLLDYSPR